MRNARLDELQAGIKISGRNTNNLRDADNTTLLAPKESASVCAGLKTPARGPGSLVLSVRR